MHFVQCIEVDAVVVFLLSIFLLSRKIFQWDQFHLLNRIDSTIITKILHFNEFPLNWRDIEYEFFPWLLFLAFQLIIFSFVSKNMGSSRPNEYTPMKIKTPIEAKRMKNYCNTLVCSVNTLIFLCGDCTKLL